MVIKKTVRDQLLVEARHRCTICAEKCFEIHHIVELADGGSNEQSNLIVLCPNCHQHRYHRSGEFTRDQLHLYKERLKERVEIESRVLKNLEEIREMMPTVSTEECEKKLRQELTEAASLVSVGESPEIFSGIQKTSEWLAERDLIRGGARKAIEIEWDLRKEQEKRKFPEIQIERVDDNAFSKAPDFERAYYLEFILNHVPNRDWSEIFIHKWQNSFYNMKRKTEIRRDRIVMIVADSDDLQKHADFAKRLVKETNEFVKLRLFPQIDEQGEQQKRSALEQFDAIQSMKSRTRDIKV
jgi:hypothetical protein